MKKKIIFKRCTICDEDLGPHNCERISVNELGLWYTHSACGGTGFMPIAEVEKRSNEKAKGDPFKQIEIDYYKERFSEK